MLKKLVCTSALLLSSTLRAQQIPPKALETTSLSQVKVALREDKVYFIDFGIDAFAQLKLNLGDVAAHQKIIACLGEKLADSNHLDPNPGGSIRFLQTTFTDGTATLTKGDARRIPGDVGAVMPFRYVELKGLPEGMSTESVAKAVTQVAVNYAFDESAADFSCSDDKLNAVRNLCKYSIKATSYGGIFEDGDRERKPYEADSYINGLGWFCCTSDLSLPVISDRYLIDHPTWPSEWSMFTVLCAWND